jgi:cation:H+ antiporter
VQIALQALLLAGGLALAIFASDLAVTNTRSLAAALGAPAFVVGIALVSIGTDLPEIANSIAAHVQGEGDVNVGDSVGSTLTQYTLVMGVFPAVVAVIAVQRRQAVVVSLLTCAGLGLTIWFVSDGWLGRAEGGVLIGAWIVFMVVAVRLVGGEAADKAPDPRGRSRAFQAGVVLVSLGLVGLGATVAVRALVKIARLAGVPEFLIAFFGASLGTSAPELVVDITALLRGAPGIALGDAMGSSLVDSTLSIGAGPVIAPASVTPGLAIVGSVYSLAAIAVVGTLLAVRRRLDRRAGFVLLVLYAISYVVLIRAA